MVRDLLRGEKFKNTDFLNTDLFQNTGSTSTVKWHRKADTTEEADTAAEVDTKESVKVWVIFIFSSFRIIDAFTYTYTIAHASRFGHDVNRAGHSIGRHVNSWGNSLTHFFILIHTVWLNLIRIFWWNIYVEFLTLTIITVYLDTPRKLDRFGKSIAKGFHLSSDDIAVGLGNVYVQPSDLQEYYRKKYG